MQYGCDPEPGYKKTLPLACMYYKQGRVISVPSPLWNVPLQNIMVGDYPKGYLMVAPQAAWEAS